MVWYNLSYEHTQIRDSGADEVVPVQVPVTLGSLTLGFYLVGTWSSSSSPALLASCELLGYLFLSQDLGGGEKGKDRLGATYTR